MAGLGDMRVDDIGKYFCAKHRREICHECCCDYEILNHQVEIQKGIRKPLSEIQTLAEQKTMLRKGINFMINNRTPANDPNLVFHFSELRKIEQRLSDLRSNSDADLEISNAINAAVLKQQARDAEMVAVASAWAKQNPGKTSMEFGGIETQQLFDQFAAAPPSALNNRADSLVCGYCGKSSAHKLKLCSRCKNVAYCGTECQTVSWKGHKKVCRPQTSEKSTTGNKTEKKTKLPLTWEQLQAFGTLPAEGKVIITFGWCCIK